jgi:hypothetical protein
MDRNPIEPGVELTGQLLRDALDGAAAQPIGGLGINVTGAPWGGSPVISLARPLPRVRQAIPVRLSNPAVIADNVWEYEWIEIAKAGSGGAGWVEVPDGRTSDDFGLALNMAEIDNSESGVQGNGIDADNIPEGFAIMPATGCTTVYQVEVPAEDDTGTGYDTEYWFDKPNGIDGQCTTVVSPSLVGGDWQFERSADAGDLAPYWTGDVSLYSVDLSGGKNVNGVLRIEPAAGVGSTADLLGPLAPIGVREGDRHRVRAQVIADGTGAEVRLVAVLYDEAGAVDTTYTSSPTTPGGSWAELTLEFTIPAGVATARVGVRHDPSVSAGPATLVDDVFWTTSFAATEIEYDGSGGDWSPDPDNVGDALDQAESRIAVVEGVVSVIAGDYLTSSNVAKSVTVSGGALELVSDETTPDDWKVYGQAGGSRAWLHPVGRLLQVQFGENAASSGTNRYLYTSNVTGTTVEGKSFIVPAACSVVGAWMRCDVTAYTSGDIRFDVRKWSGSEAALVTGGTFGLSGAANNVSRAEEYAPGTYQLAAGDGVILRRVIDSGGCTTDEHVGGVLLLLDETWAGA